MSQSLLTPEHLTALRAALRAMLEDPDAPWLAQHTAQIHTYLDGAGWSEGTHLAMVVLAARWTKSKGY